MKLLATAIFRTKTNYDLKKNLLMPSSEKAFSHGDTSPSKAN